METFQYQHSKHARFLNESTIGITVASVVIQGAEFT